jgi:hypothetical protein
VLLELGDDGRLDTEWFHIDARRQRSSDGLVRGRGVVIFLEREDDVPKIYSKDTGMRNMGR